ncbi:MAG: neutral/alkaline non-lysosomal ceramidase N-terminal domain-containing protein, partial [Limisphaerales bacterium]
TNGEVRALLINYACHCTTLSHEPNQICADWAGYAQEYVEKEHPGAIAMTIMGCGADANPFPRGSVDYAKQHGQEISKAVDESLAKPFQPIDQKLECRAKRITLSFQTLPNRQEWERRAALKGPSDYPTAYHARKNLARLDRGEKLPTELPYLVQEWNFGDEIAMVFLCGEVVVDYSLRLKTEFDKSRLWVNGYSNEVPCYIPSRRILKEGGYEAGGAMIYYDLPAWLAESTEDRIVDAVHAIVPKPFLANKHF